MWKRAGCEGSTPATQERSHAARPHLESIFDAFDPLNDADIPSALDPLPDSDIDDLDRDLNGPVGEIEDPDTLVVIDDEVYQESNGNLAEVDVDSNVIGGTDEGDVLVGAPDDNVIYGGDGNDDATGKSGVDLLIGGGDQLVGGDGNDRLEGHAGNDVMFAGNGNDALNGGLGADRLSSVRVSTSPTTGTQRRPLRHASMHRPAIAVKPSGIGTMASRVSWARPSPIPSSEMPKPTASAVAAGGIHVRTWRQ